jgi:BlaI family transcriptional regulator, penicillinase repressor
MHIVLADREAEIMEVLWTLGPSTVAEVREQLADSLAYTTVLTILRNLEAKGYVGHGAEGRAHRYVPLVAQEAARTSALKDLAKKLFSGSSQLLMAHLVPDKTLSAAELKRIQRLIDQNKLKGRRQWPRT